MKRHLLKSVLWWLCVILSVSLAGCSKDDPSIPDGTTDIIDEYIGPYYEFILGQETEGLATGKIRILLQASDGTEFERIASHLRSSSRSQISLTSGLREGVYRLLAALPDEGSEDDEPEFGLGSRIEVTKDGIRIIDSYNPQLGLAGEGTKEDPFIVSSPSHLFNLMMAVNDYDSNSFFTPSTYFSQVRNLDMKTVSRNCDLEYGWMPIGSDPNIPFRGVYLADGHCISNLMINRPHSTGLGLFGYIIDSTIDGVIMKNCSVSGMYGVGTLAGVVLSSGNKNRGRGSITNCRLENSKLECPDNSAAIGGLLGAVDMHATGLIASCSVSGTKLSGGMNVGGILGGAAIYSSVTATDVTSENSTITSQYSGAGGIIGTADTLQVVSGRNLSEVRGSVSGDNSMPRIGAGGIVGGAGYAWLTACRNTASVNGYEGVGGIIGSTRIKGGADESFLYNQAYLRHCSNTAPVTGTNMTGGLIGEAQAGVESGYNTGVVTASNYIGGICGNSSVGVFQNVVNAAKVDGKNYVGGILGKTTWGSLANCQNLSEVRAQGSPAGGILGLGGNNTMIHYCSNFGVVSGTSHSTLGGIVGEIGDPRKWTTTNIVECVVGSLEIAMGFIGPVISYVEEAYELAHGVEIAIKLIEKGADLALISADYTLFGYGLPELISPEAEEELKASMTAGTEKAYAEIDSEISALRNSVALPSIPMFPGSNLSSYINNIEVLTSSCADESTSERLQDGINEARAERAEALEKIAKAHEIAHTVISGVAIAVSTATFIAGTVATGGAATAVLAIGTAASIVGGANALIKSCSEFENNAVVISQCVNAAPVTTDISTTVSSIAGKICDGVLVQDCLSAVPTSEGNLGIFVGTAGNHASIKHCISVTDKYIGIPSSYFNNCLSSSSKASETLINYNGNVTFLLPSQFSDPTILSMLGLDKDMGSGKRWNTPEGLPFPIPEKSCYL